MHVHVLRLSFLLDVVILGKTLPVILSLEEDEVLSFKADCWSVFEDHSGIKVGTENGVQWYSWDASGKKKILHRFKPKGAEFHCLRLHGRQVFHLQNEDTVWNLSKLKTEYEVHPEPWIHSDCVKKPNQFVIHNDIIYAPNRGSNVVKQYALTGETAGKDIRIGMTSSSTFICATREGNLILSQTAPSLLVCFNPKNGKELWRRKDLQNPQSVAIDRHTSHLLVFTENLKTRKATIDVRATNTGNMYSNY